ncbi:hypothetical protein BT69DRAFT_1284641 [Atractiella rhizophila]|nr:hypothetical protein BT69DRAFT_1284641 [Atractiella rhizophila]
MLISKFRFEPLLAELTFSVSSLLVLFLRRPPSRSTALRFFEVDVSAHRPSCYVAYNSPTPFDDVSQSLRSSSSLPAGREAWLFVFGARPNWFSPCLPSHQHEHNQRYLHPFPLNPSVSSDFRQTLGFTPTP